MLSPSMGSSVLNMVFRVYYEYEKRAVKYVCLISIILKIEIIRMVPVIC